MSAICRGGWFGCIADYQGCGRNNPAARYGLRQITHCLFPQKEYFSLCSNCTLSLFTKAVTHVAFAILSKPFACASGSHFDMDDSLAGSSLATPRAAPGMTAAKSGAPFETLGTAGRCIHATACPQSNVHVVDCRFAQPFKLNRED